MAGKLFCFDFDNTIVNGHMHVHFANVLQVHPDDVSPGMVQEFLRSQGGIKNKKALEDTIRKILENGDAIAITSFSYYPQAIRWVLNQLDVSPYSLESIPIVAGYPSISGLTYEGGDPNHQDRKNQHIQQAAWETTQRTNQSYLPKDIVLIDDSEINVFKAKVTGYRALQVPKEHNPDPNYLAVACDISDKKLEKGLRGALQRLKRRMLGGKSKVSIKFKAYAKEQEKRDIEAHFQVLPLKKEGAQKILANQGIGTHLFRPSSKKGFYALSLKDSSGLTKHFLVKLRKNENGQFEMKPAGGDWVSLHQQYTSGQAFGAWVKQDQYFNSGVELTYANRLTQEGLRQLYQVQGPEAQPSAYDNQRAQQPHETFTPQTQEHTQTAPQRAHMAAIDLDNIVKKVEERFDIHPNMEVSEARAKIQSHPAGAHLFHKDNEGQTHVTFKYDNGATDSWPVTIWIDNNNQFQMRFGDGSRRTEQEFYDYQGFNINFRIKPSEPSIQYSKLPNAPADKPENTPFDPEQKLRELVGHEQQPVVDEATRALHERFGVHNIDYAQAAQMLESSPAGGHLFRVNEDGSLLLNWVNSEGIVEDTPVHIQANEQGAYWLTFDNTNWVSEDAFYRDQLNHSSRVNPISQQVALDQSQAHEALTQSVPTIRVQTQAQDHRHNPQAVSELQERLQERAKAVAENYAQHKNIRKPD